MAVQKGGRGIKGDYETKVVRVPEPIRLKVDEIIQNFRDGKDLGQLEVFHRDYAITEAKKILSSKKSAKLSLTKLLQVLYCDETIEL